MSPRDQRSPLPTPTSVAHSAAKRDGNPTQLELWADIVEINSQHPGIVQLCTAFAAEAFDPNHPAHEYFKTRFANAQEAISHQLRAAHEAGDAQVDDPDATAAYLLALSDGLRMRWLIDPSCDMTATFRSAVANVFSGHAMPASINLGRHEGGTDRARMPASHPPTCGARRRLD